MLLHVQNIYIYQHMTNMASVCKCKIASWTPMLQKWTIDESLQVQVAVRSKPSLSSASSNLPAAWLPLLSKPCDKSTWHQDIPSTTKSHKIFHLFQKKQTVKQPSMMCSVPSIRIPSRGGSHLNMPHKPGTFAGRNKAKRTESTPTWCSAKVKLNFGIQRRWKSFSRKQRWQSLSRAGPVPRRAMASCLFWIFWGKQTSETWKIMNRCSKYVKIYQDISRWYTHIHAFLSIVRGALGAAWASPAAPLPWRQRSRELETPRSLGQRPCPAADGQCQRRIPGVPWNAPHWMPHPNLNTS